MPRAQEPAQNESEGVVDDDPLNLLWEALVTHLASPAMSRRHRWPLHDPEVGLVELGESHAMLSTRRRPFQRASHTRGELHLEMLERWTMRHHE